MCNSHPAVLLDSCVNDAGEVVPDLRLHPFASAAPQVFICGEISLSSVANFMVLALSTLHRRTLLNIHLFWHSPDLRTVERDAHAGKTLFAELGRVPSGVG